MPLKKPPQSSKRMGFRELQDGEHVEVWAEWLMPREGIEALCPHPIPRPINLFCLAVSVLCPFIINWWSSK